MTEYSKLARGSFTSAGTAKVITLPFVPGSIEIWNYTNANASPTANKVVAAYWNAAMGQGYALETAVYNATPVLVADSVISGGFTTFQGGLSQQFGARVGISGITKASSAVVTTTAAHGYSVGDTVVFQGLNQSSTTGMQQIAGMPFTISAVGSTTSFTIKWNTNQSNYTALSGSPSGAYVMKVLYPFLYVPQDNVVSAITTGSTTTVTTTMYHNLVVGQQIAFRIPTIWGTTQLNSLPNTTIPGSPVYGYVTSLTDNWTFVCSINSTSYTAFNSNQAFASYPGEQFPQAVPVGDVNSGGWPYSATSALYPSPSFPTSSGGAVTINGPAIQGAFVNNTSQGFIIGIGAGTNLTSSVLVGANSDVIYWEATAFDLVLT